VSVKRAARIGDAWLIVNTSGLGKVMPLMQTYRAALKEYGRIRWNAKRVYPFWRRSARSGAILGSYKPESCFSASAASPCYSVVRY
jgi:hypothetical protein